MGLGRMLSMSLFFSFDKFGFWLTFPKLRAIYHNKA